LLKKALLLLKKYGVKAMFSFSTPKTGGKGEIEG
jgi:hypothetical protein